MSHYFTKDNNTLKSNPHVIAFSANGIPLKFKTDHGVFSRTEFDEGTRILLKYIEVANAKTVLDLGCGYGVIGIYIAKQYQLDIDMVDINNRAVMLSKDNSTLNNVNTNVFYSDGFEAITRKYDLILFNPPIRAGKKVFYKLFEESVSYLNEFGSFYIVINKKHGAVSAINKLKTIYRSVEIIDKEKGFNVVECKM
ncbi:MAG: methyltransferase [Candidatus Izemoplasma sp.]